MERSGGASAIWQLIALNVVVFVVWQIVGPGQIELMRANFLVSLDSVLSLRVWTLLTSAVSHIDTTHLLFNMIGLYVFGRDIERLLGGQAIWHLYIAGGLMGSVGHVLYSALSGSPNPALGASAAVMALAVIYGGLFPKRTLLINFFIPVPARLAVVLFIGLDLLGTFGLGGAGVANAAHLGGAAYGLGYYLLRIRPRLQGRS